MLNTCPYCKTSENSDRDTSMYNVYIQWNETDKNFQTFWLTAFETKDTYKN